MSVKCKICGKRLRPDDRNLCNDCFEFYAWKHGGEEGVENVLEQYEVQKNADRQKSCHKRR